MRKSQSASGAAGFLAIMTILIILYILFLPPDIRDELLTGGKTTTNISGGSISDSGQNILLKQNIGKVTYINTNDKTYDIPTVRVYAPVSGQLLKSVPQIVLKNALFDKEKALFTMDFSIDTKATENIKLSFNILEHYGPLSIKVNGKEIFNGELAESNPKPITLSDLQEENTITFSVPNPGVVFWRSNKYALENIQITGDVKDFSNSYAVQYFTISEAEKENLESISLYFRPVCTASDVGPLSIELNKRILFNTVADCGTRSFAGLDINNVYPGNNELRFGVEKGSYLLDNIMVKLNLKEPSYKTYYFDLDDKYFIKNPETARCGDYDDTCPPGCSDIRDADCCFKHNGYWCGLPTDNPNDRCVYYVDPGDCDSCLTGYVDEGGDTSDTCEEKCGDNNDGICPSDCPSPARYYDADCCYAVTEDNFFCQEVPITGINDRCRAAVSYSQCTLCPSGFEDESGSGPESCTDNNFDYKDEEEEFDSDYDVKLVVTFTNDEDRKRVDININGRKISIDTKDLEFKKNIDDYVRSGTNSIEIIPREDVEIAQLKVELIKVS